MLTGSSGNISSFGALCGDSRQLSSTLASLSSGARTEAALEPAAVIAAESLHAELASIDARARTVQRADAVAAVADGALGEMSEMLIRGRALAVSAANTGGMSEAESAAIAMEMASIAESVDRLASSTSFAGLAVFDGALTLSVSGESFSIPAVSAARMGEVTIVGETYSLQSLTSGKMLFDPKTPVAILEAAGDQVATLRGRVGAFRNSVLESLGNVLSDAFANTAGSRSVIIDTDYAEAAAELLRTRTLAAGRIKALALAKEPSPGTRDLLAGLMA